MADQWTVSFLNEAVLGEIEQQPDDVRASFLRIAELIATHGLENMREPYVKPLQGKIWECG